MLTSSWVYRGEKGDFLFNFKIQYKRQTLPPALSPTHRGFLPTPFQPMLDAPQSSARDGVLTWPYNSSRSNNRISNELSSSPEDRRGKVQSLLSKTELLFCFLLHLKPPLGPGVWRWVRVQRTHLPVVWSLSATARTTGPQLPPSSGDRAPHFIFPLSSCFRNKESLWHFRHGILRKGSFSCQRSQTLPLHLLLSKIISDRRDRPPVTTKGGKHPSAAFQRRAVATFLCAPFLTS